MTEPSPFKFFKTSPEIVRLAEMMYVRFPLSFKNVEDLLHELSVEISHEKFGSGGTCSDQREGPLACCRSDGSQALAQKMSKSASNRATVGLWPGTLLRTIQ